MSLLGPIFWYIDVAIAISMITIVVVLFKLEKIDKFVFSLFWIGTLIGFTWEIPIFVVNQFGIYPFLQYLTPIPFSFIIVIISHSVWDGGLFLMGMGLVYLIRKTSLFENFNLKELFILIIWGQIQAIGIEMIGSFGGAWEYIPYPWNPAFLTLLGHHFTIFIQVVWLAASISFYFIALKVKERMQ